MASFVVVGLVIAVNGFLVSLEASEASVSFTNSWSFDLEINLNGVGKFNFNFFASASAMLPVIALFYSLSFNDWATGSWLKSPERPAPEFEAGALEAASVCFLVIAANFTPPFFSSSVFFYSCRCRLLFFFKILFSGCWCLYSRLLCVI